MVIYSLDKSWDTLNKQIGVLKEKGLKSLDMQTPGTRIQMIGSLFSFNKTFTTFVVYLCDLVKSQDSEAMYIFIHTPHIHHLHVSV